MGMQVTNIPKLLAPEIIGSSLDEYNGTFSPDGKTFYFTTTTPKTSFICFTEIDKNGTWKPATIAPFSGIFSEYDPIFAPDGKKLFFSSERPIPNDSTEGITRIWFIENQDSIWTKPQLVNLEKNGVYYSSLTNKGEIYFNIWDSGDMYKATKINNAYKIDTLPEILNSENGEGDPFISPKEDYLIFRGYNNSLGRGDLYISYKINEEWTEPENLGEPINSSSHEMCPYVTIDREFFIFASSRILKDYKFESNSSLEKIRMKHQSHDNGQLNIYYISADFIEERRKKHE